MRVKTIVVNKRKEEFDIYIGRGSLFGNPFVIGIDGDRRTVIKKFREYFYQRIENDMEFREAVLKLQGKKLGCFCKPHDCHGDIIVEYLNEK